MRRNEQDVRCKKQGMRCTSAQGGFTLLEVMLAFAILAILTGQLGQMIHENMVIAADAIDQREMREIADRYSIYRWRLRKEQVVAAGVSDPNDDAEGLFGDDDDESESSSSDEDEADKGSIKLIRFTLTVYRSGSPEDPLITLTRFLPPPEFQETGG